MSIDLSSIQKKPSAARIKSSNPERSIWKKDIKIGSAFGNKEKVSFYKELGSLLEAGVDFKRSLEIIAQQQPKKAQKKYILSITQDVIGGKSLHESMRDVGVFSPYEYFSIKIGEESRSLAGVLPELGKYFERKIQMKRQLTSVLLYPSFVLLLTFGVLYFMMNYVVPMFSTVFKQFNRELPSLTQKIIYLSEHFSVLVISVVLFLVTCLITHYFLKSKARYRELMAHSILYIPFFGKLVQKIYVTRFSQTLSLLLKSKTPLVNAIELVEKMISYYPLEKSLAVIKKDIKRGSSFSNALKKHKIYDHKMISLVHVAEEANTLDTTFERLALQYDEETTHQTKMLGVIMEPLIILVIGFVVGIVLIAMYAPMFDLSKILQPN